ncbi:hypothetical protein CPB85DRAFT_874392 [Mucidula mucida]|nr:hypothetical protein CPB85DRAFT_874392 [Mucidula mucida]
MLANVTLQRNMRTGVDTPKPLQPHLYEVAPRMYLLIRRRNKSQALLSRGICRTAKLSPLNHFACSRRALVSSEDMFDSSFLASSGTYRLPSGFSTTARSSIARLAQSRRNSRDAYSVQIFRHSGALLSSDHGPPHIFTPLPFQSSKSTVSSGCTHMYLPTRTLRIPTQAVYDHRICIRARRYPYFACSVNVSLRSTYENLIVSLSSTSSSI